MAADVTLIALPSTPENWRRAEYLTYQRSFPDDEAFYDDDGEIVAYTYTDTRRELHRAVCDIADFHEVGPVSYLKAGLSSTEHYLPGPTVAVHRYWAKPALVRAVDVTQTMVCMNMPNRSYYRGRAWRSRHGRPRQVRRWLMAHLGWIVWAETW